MSYKLHLIIDWIDPETRGDSSWQSIDEDMTEYLLKPIDSIRTVGYLMSYVPGSHLCLTDTVGSADTGMIWKIPMSAICNIQEVSESKKIDMAYISTVLRATGPWSYV